MHSVALLIAEGVSAFEVGITAEVFGVRRSGLDWHDYRLKLVAPRPGPVATSGGFSIDGAAGMPELRTADTVLVAPAVDGVETDLPEETATELRAARARGARIASLCVGAFVLAKAGLLDGLTATTHWRSTDRLAREFPHVQVQPNVLFVDNGQVLTSAGAAASLDLCLHLVRRDHGAAAVAQLARRIVVAPHRPGNQAQFVETPVPDTTGHLAPLLQWALEHLDARIGVGELAAHAAVSPRTLARQFARQLGISPGQWLQAQRIERARHLLEATGDTLEVVAARSGLGSSANLRKVFHAHLGLTPAQYRRSHRVHPHRE